MSTDVKLITWMVPVTYENGYGFTTLVSPADGYYVLISEIHAWIWPYLRLDDTICFPCNIEGIPINYVKIAAGSDTASALVNLRDCWTPERHRGER